MAGDSVSDKNRLLDFTRMRLICASNDACRLTDETTSTCIPIRPIGVSMLKYCGQNEADCIFMLSCDTGEWDSYRLLRPSDDKWSTVTRELRKIHTGIDETNGDTRGGSTEVMSKLQAWVEETGRSYPRDCGVNTGKNAVYSWEIDAVTCLSLCDISIVTNITSADNTLRTSVFLDESRNTWDPIVFCQRISELPRGVYDTLVILGTEEHGPSLDSPITWVNRRHLDRDVQIVQKGDTTAFMQLYKRMSCTVRCEEGADNVDDIGTTVLRNKKRGRKSNGVRERSVRRRLTSPGANSTKTHPVLRDHQVLARHVSSCESVSVRRASPVVEMDVVRHTPKTPPLKKCGAATTAVRSVSRLGSNFKKAGLFVDDGDEFMVKAWPCLQETGYIRFCLPVTKGRLTQMCDDQTKSMQHDTQRTVGLRMLVPVEHFSPRTIGIKANMEEGGCIVVDLVGKYKVQYTGPDMQREQDIVQSVVVECSAIKDGLRRAAQEHKMEMPNFQSYNVTWLRSWFIPVNLLLTGWERSDIEHAMHPLMFGVCARINRFCSNTTPQTQNGGQSHYARAANPHPWSRALMGQISSIIPWKEQHPLNAQWSIRNRKAFAISAIRWILCFSPVDFNDVATSEAKSNASYWMQKRVGVCRHAAVMVTLVLRLCGYRAFVVKTNNHATVLLGDNAHVDVGRGL